MTVKKMMSLKDWINEEGPTSIAKKLGVGESAVRHWRRGYVLPSRQKMMKIEKLTKGKVTVNAMIEAHFSPKNKKNRWEA